jgi:uncharacterized protein (TIGR03083 family)
MDIRAAGAEHAAMTAVTPFAEPQLEPTLHAVEAACEEIAVLLHGADGQRPVPGATWTVAEAAAHLALANELMAGLADGRDLPYGDGTPGSLAAANAASLEAFTERDPDVLGRAIAAHARDFTAALRQHPGGRDVVTPMGAMTSDVLASYMLTHVLGHGYDLARALRRPHGVTRERVALTAPFMLLAMDRVVDPSAAAGHSACYALRVPGIGQWYVTFTDGTAHVGPHPPRRPDCTVLTRPVTFFLLALGRLDATGALLRGGVLAWGRKPWLAPRFPSLFRAP